MTIKDFVTKFVNLMRYVPYLREEKEKVHQFMRCLPQSYKDKFQFLNANTMDEIIRHTNLCYSEFKKRCESTKTSQNRNKDNNFDRRNK